MVALMRFCTQCAAHLDPAHDHCPACGTPVPAPVTPAPATALPSGQRGRQQIVRWLYIAPLAFFLVIAAAQFERERAQQSSLASVYAAASTAEETGDLVAARDAFASLIGYRDASLRAEILSRQLAPFELDYDGGLEAMQRGDYPTAIRLLESVVAAAPTLGDVRYDLANAKRLYALDLRSALDAAVTVRDWPAAEQRLRALAALTQDSPGVRQELVDLVRTHGPLLLGKDRDLWLASPDGQADRQLTQDLEVVWPTWSPDRSQVAFLAPVSGDPTGTVALYVLEVLDPQPRLLITGISSHAPPAWSPDGSKIAYTSFTGYDTLNESGSIGVRMVDIASAQETDLTGAAFSLAFNPTWAPDGARIAFVAKTGDGRGRPQHTPGDLYEVALGQTSFKNLTNGRVPDIWNASWSPHGQQLLLFSLFGQTWYEPPETAIRLLDLQENAISVVATMAEQPTMPMWSPDGSRFAFTQHEQEIAVASSDGSYTPLPAEETLSGDLTWSPDGQALLLAPWNANDASILLQFDGGERKITTAKFSFDASPPFMAPPQWAPVVAIPPEQNLFQPISTSPATGPR